MYVALGVKPDSEEEGRTKVKSQGTVPVIQELNIVRPTQKRFIYRPLTRHDFLPVLLVADKYCNSYEGGKLCTGQTVVLTTKCC
jgi:hypothetical protein